ASDRDDLLARRPRAARLRERAEPRLSRSVCNALHLLARRSRREPDLRSHLHLGRSAYRFRDAGGMMDAPTRPLPPETVAPEPMGVVTAPRIGAANLSPINRRRWQNFKRNKRGWWSFWIFLVLFGLSLFAEFIANDKPLFVSYQGHWYYPVFARYAETTFGGDFETEADYRDPYLVKLIAEKGGYMIFPLIHYRYDTHNLDLPTPAPSPP